MNYKTLIDHKGLVLFGVAIVIFFVAGTYRLSESPGIWYDEGYYSQAAMNLALHGAQALQVAPGQFVSTWSLTVGYPVIYPVAFFYKLFGVGVLQGRAIMVLYMFGFLTASFFLIRRLFGSWYAGWSSLLIATLPLLYGNGKTILGEVPSLFFIMLALIALFRLEKTNYRRSWLYIAFGLCIGLAFAAKITFGLVGLAILIVWLFNIKKVRLDWMGLVFAVAAAVLAVLCWVATQFNLAELPLVVAFYLNPYAVSSGIELSSILANLKLFVSDTTPFYTLGALVLWSISLYIRRGTVTVAEQVAYVFSLEIAVFFLLVPGWYRYLFAATITSILFLPASLFYIADFTGAHIQPLAKARNILYILLGLLVLGQAYQLAHGSFVAGYYQSTRTRDLAAYFQALPATTTVFVYNVPEVAVFLPEGNYYQFFHPTPQVSIDQDPDAVGKEELPLLAQGVPDEVVLQTTEYKSNLGQFDQYKESVKISRYSILIKK